VPAPAAVEATVAPEGTASPPPGTWDLTELPARELTRVGALAALCLLLLVVATWLVDAVRDRRPPFDVLAIDGPGARPAAPADAPPVPTTGRAQ
jgi:hypothetical protein